MPDLPSGTVTFLFTDIEGSTRPWEEHPEAMQVALARHDAFLRQAMETHGGHVFKSMGDQFCAAFASASDTLAAAGRVALTRSSVADESRTWPPWATARRRATRLRGGPK